MSFALQFTVPASPEPTCTAPMTYDPDLQLNILPDGTPACMDEEWLIRTGSTTSTAGSKTHFDD